MSEVKNCLSYALKIEGISKEEQRFATEQDLDPNVSVLPKLEKIANAHSRKLRFVGNSLEEAKAEVKPNEWLICLFGFWSEVYSYFGCGFTKVIEYHFVRQDSDDKWSQLDFNSKAPKAAYIDHMLNFCEAEGVKRHEFYAVKEDC